MMTMLLRLLLLLLPPLVRDVLPALPGGLLPYTAPYAAVHHPSLAPARTLPSLSFNCLPVLLPYCCCTAAAAGHHLLRAAGSGAGGPGAV